MQRKIIAAGLAAGLAAALIIVAGIIVAGWRYWAENAPYIAEQWTGKAGLEQAGQWGDSFGAFNALFGALGFSVVFTTLFIQARALRLQQKDTHRQRFESSFFQLLNLLREVRGELRFRYSDEFTSDPENATKSKRTKVGKEAAISAVRELRYWIEKNGGSKGIDKGRLVALYEDKVHRRYESDFGPYFRLIYTIMERIRCDDLLTEEERARYGNILRSQLPSHETFLLGLNGLSKVSKDLSKLIYEFRMLKYLPPGLRRNTLKRFYLEAAFAPRHVSEAPPLLARAEDEDSEIEDVSASQTNEEVREQQVPQSAAPREQPTAPENS